MTNSFSRLLLAWLSDNDRSQSWLARQVGCSRSHISHILSGRGYISSDVVAKISKTTGLDCEYLQYLCGRFPADIIKGSKLSQSGFENAIACFRGEWDDEID